MQTADLAKFPRSKIGPPHQPRAPIERRRLLEQLDSGAQLVLVIAPAGSGKTSLLASWVNEHKAGGGTAADINSSERPFVWYGLDPSDQDPARMVDGLAAAAEFSLPGAGAAARSMLAGGAGPYAALAALLAAFEQMTAATLILDNCHHINGARSAEAILEHITRNCPPSLRLVMSSRGIPLLPALSAVASGQLRTIGRDDLQFRTDEASVLLAQYGLPEDAVPELLRSSRGWAMGLLLHAHTHMGNVTFLQRPSEALAEYLMVQVVDSLPDLTRTFLLESALLGTFDAATADTVLERSDSWVQIDSVVRHGLFLDVYAGSTGPAVRYHDLFGEALAETLRRSAPERFIAIHTRACEFHNDDPHRALGHSAMLADPTHLAGQLDIFLPTLRRQGHWEAIIRYAELLHESKRSLLLVRYLSYAYYVRGDDSAALAAAEQAHARSLAEGDEEAKYSALVLRANSQLRQDRTVEVLEYCLPALEQAHASGLASAESWLAEIAAKCLLSEGRVADGRTMVRRAQALHRQKPNNSGARALGWFNQDVAPFFIELGEGQTAALLLEEASTIATDNNDRSLFTFCQATRTELLLQRGELSAAMSLAETVNATALEEGNLIARYTSLRSLAKALAQLGRPQEAFTVLDQYIGLVATWPAPIRLKAQLVRARLSTLSGDRADAREALSAIMALGASERTSGQVALEQGALALAEDRDIDADKCLDFAISSLEKYRLEPQLALALVLRAQALTRLGKKARAVACLSQAGALADGKEWLAAMVADVAPALATLRGLDAYWRVQGKGRELIERLLQTDQRHLRLLPGKPDPVRTIHHRPEQQLTSEEPLRFIPFGHGAIVLAGNRMQLTRLGSEKAREMLAYAIWQARPVLRDEILDALWDGSADEQTFGAFRKASYQIRRFLGGDVWQRVHGAYVLTTQVDDDYRKLLALAVSLEDADAPAADVAAMATQALGLYTGPYLQWCYSDWTEGPRRLSQTAVLTVISALVSARRKLGQPAAALEAAERGLALEPSSETLRHSQIRLLTELGRPVEALESYRYHLRVLEDEDLGSPSEELRTLVALIKR